MREIYGYSLKAHNTFGIEAKCRRFLEYSTANEARLAAQMLRHSQEPFLIIGSGSNLLLTQDFEGTVVCSALKGIEPLENGRLRCGSGEVWDDVVAWAVQQQLYGAENLSLIPGQVGASAVQNIGAYGVEVKDLITQVEAIDIATGTLCVFTREQCQYGYRDSRFKHEWHNRYLITHVEYQLSPTAKLHLEYGNIRSELDRQGIATPTLQQLRQTIIDIRRQKLPDPDVTGNAGSFFMNPVVSRKKFLELQAEYPDMPHYNVSADLEKIPAAWMIDQCGWRGQSLGRAGVHSRQALVLVNLGGATGQEIVTLCQAIQKDVSQRFGIDIHPEVNIV